MRQTTVVLAALACALCLALVSPAAPPAGARIHDTVHTPRLPKGRLCGAPAVVAHRGSPFEAPENTLPGFEAAVAGGADWVETDIRTTSDGVQVIMHDSRVNRTTDGRGRVSRMTADQIAGLRVDVGPGGPAPVPTLRQVLRQLRGTGVGLLMDIKPPQTHHDVAAIVRQAEASGVSTVFGTRDPQVMRWAHARSSSMPLDFVVGATDPRSWLDEAAQAAPVRGVSLTFDLAATARIDAEHEAGHGVYAWTIDTPADWRTAAALGADAVITDRPREAAAWVRDRCAGEPATGVLPGEGMRLLRTKPGAFGV